MFENFLTNLKNQTNNLTDNLRAKTRRFAFNVNSFKEKLVSKPKTTYYTINRKEECDYFDNNDYLSPRAYDKWPSITENMQWVPYVPPKLDEQNIVDRFIKVITIDDDNDNVSQTIERRCLFLMFTCFCRGELIAKKSGEGWRWDLKMIIIVDMTGRAENPVCNQDYRVVSDFLFVSVSLFSGLETRAVEKVVYVVAVLAFVCLDFAVTISTVRYGNKKRGDSLHFSK